MEAKGAAAPASPTPADLRHFTRVCRLAVVVALVCLVAETLAPTQYGKFAAASSLPIDSRVGW